MTCNTWLTPGCGRWKFSQNSVLLLFQFGSEDVLKNFHRDQSVSRSVNEWMTKLFLGQPRLQRADMQKDNFFTQTRFEQKIFYLKKCVNYDKSNLGQNSVKGLKDTNNTKKLPKSNNNFKMCQKNATKSAKLCHYSLSRQNSVKFCKYFTPYRIFYTNIGQKFGTSPVGMSWDWKSSYSYLK